MLTPAEAKAFGDMLKDAIVSREPDFFDDATLLKIFELVDTISEPRMMGVGPYRPLAVRQALATRLELAALAYLNACGWWRDFDQPVDHVSLSPPSGSGVDLRLNPRWNRRALPPILEALVHNTTLEPWLLAQDALFSENTNPETAKPAARQSFTPATPDPSLVSYLDDDDDGPIELDEDD